MQTLTVPCLAMFRTFMNSETPCEASDICTRDVWVYAAEIENPGRVAFHSSPIYSINDHQGKLLSCDCRYFFSLEFPTPIVITVMEDASSSMTAMHNYREKNDMRERTWHSAWSSGDTSLGISRYARSGLHYLQDRLSTWSMHGESTMQSVVI